MNYAVIVLSLSIQQLDVKLLMQHHLKLFLVNLSHTAGKVLAVM